MSKTERHPLIDRRILRDRIVYIIYPGSFLAKTPEGIVTQNLASLLQEFGALVSVVDRDSKGKAQVLTPAMVQALLKPASISVDTCSAPLTAASLAEGQFGRRQFMKFLELLWSEVKLFGHHLKMLWWVKQVRRILVKLDAPDLVLTREPYAGLAAAGIVGDLWRRARWASNWNDPFPRSAYPTPYGTGDPNSHRLVFGRVRRVPIDAAHFVSFPSERLRTYMLGEFPQGDPQRSALVIRHAGPWFKSAVLSARTQGGYCRFVYSGAWNPERHPKTVFAALRNYNERTVNVKCQIDYYGPDAERIASEAQNAGVGSAVSCYRSVPYEEMLQRISLYDGAIVAEADQPVGVFLPTKLVDLIFLRIPILIITPRVSEVRDLCLTMPWTVISDDCTARSVCRAFNDFADRIRTLQQLSEAASAAAIREPFTTEIVQSYSSMLRG